MSKTPEQMAKECEAMDAQSKAQEEETAKLLQAVDALLEQANAQNETMAAKRARLQSVIDQAKRAIEK